MRIYPFAFLALAAFLNSAAVENPRAPLKINGAEGLQEANDRDYYPVVRHLIASSKKSIDLSLDTLSVGNDTKDPVQTLLNDLTDTARRQVKVRLFLNTNSDANRRLPFFLRDDLLAALKKANVEVHYVSPGYRLHDRLMIVDGEWILEGGLGWTRKDLEEGYGSSTLSRSAELATKKRVRLELLPLWNLEVQKSEVRDGGFPVPVYLMRDLKYLPGMVSSEDSDAMKIYFALLRHFFTANQMKLSIPLEELVSEIPADLHFAAAESAFQVIKALERLEQVYGLIKIDQKGPSRVELMMILPSDMQPSVRVPLLFFQEGYAKQLSGNALFAYLVIQLRAQASGDSPVWLGSEKNVEQDFPVTRERFRMGIDELKRKNLIEVYPFRLQNNYSRLENTEYRYVLNPVATLSEKLELWTRLRDEYGDQNFNRAKQMAEALEEDEDPKVIAVYLDLLKEFPPQNILSMTQHVVSLPESGTPQRLAYLRELLEHEIPDTSLAAS